MVPRIWPTARLTTITHHRRLYNPSLVFQHNMASSPPADVWEWLVIVPDKPGSKEKRLQVRPTHLKNMTTLTESQTDIWKMGGVLLNELPGVEASTNPAGWDFHGSTIVMRATSREEIIGALEGDIYVKEGVWDLDKIQMWPLKAAFRIP